MAITFDDQPILEGHEAVTVTSVRRTGDATASTATAVRYPMTTREASASFGVYQLGDVVWTLDTSEVSSIAPLKPRDKVTDSDGIDWTMLDAVKSPIANFWKCTTRALAIVNDLADRMDIYRPRPTQAQDDPGNREPVFMPFKLNLACRIQEISRNVVDAFGKRVTEIGYEIFTAETLAVTNEDQIRANGRIYDITGMVDAERIDALGKILAVWRF